MRVSRYPFARWHVEAGRVITNGRVRIYLAGARDEKTSALQYEPCWLDKQAHVVCRALNRAKDTGEYLD